MSFTINREIFDRVKTAIAETGRINMLSWAEVQDSAMAESVDEIRGLSLPDNCRTTSCIGGLICYLATSEEITRAAEIYELSDNEVQEPSILSNAICATFRDNEIELRAASEETGEAEEIIPADLSLGQAMEAGFNAKYLRDFLTVAPEGDIRIYFKDAQTQFEMRSAESRWVSRYIIMPMRL